MSYGRCFGGGSRFRDSLGRDATHRQDRTRRTPQYLLGDAAHHDTGQAGAAVRPHDDQDRLPFPAPTSAMTVAGSPSSRRYSMVMVADGALSASNIAFASPRFSSGPT